MKKSEAVAALAALAQDNRLDVFRLLVQAGPEGMAAGAVSAALRLAPNTLTFYSHHQADIGRSAGNKRPLACLGSIQVACMGPAPEVVLLPWMLDSHPHHKNTNRLLADAAQDFDFLVLGYEVWGLLSPNAYFDITDVQDRKRDLIALHASQLRTVDYLAYSEAPARVRAFHNPIRENRTGAVEAFVALPSSDYCDLVRHAIGQS